MCSLRVLTVLTVALAASSAVAPAYAQEPVALTAWQIGKSGTRVVTSPIGDGLLLDGSRRGWLRSRDGAGDLIGIKRVRHHRHSAQPEEYAQRDWGKRGLPLLQDLREVGGRCG